MIVSNSSPIIILGKLGFLELLKKCFTKVIIPKAVFEEVFEKKESVEAKLLEKAINEKWLAVQDVEVNLRINTQNLGNGEKEAISLAAELNTFLLIDDGNARSYASILSVENHGTFYVVYLSVLKEFIDKATAKKIVDRMIQDGFYISTELYAEFLELLGEI